ncbi:unnamed protein product [Rodentolepis nana]|uniref:Mitochondrial ribosomal protein S34 n=1 Tax=Rodentolepis nana TaxID=102285 RepID=A0A0R3T1Z4_RODNA|nr:unnamed protein product [Rodentolepis nana]
MTKVKYVGRPSLNFYGKYLSEIARNLRNKGAGRIVVKESEERFYKEPSYYVIKDIEPLMSDSSGVRCRAWAERVFRGHNFGVVPVPKSHEPDWRLLSLEEGRRLQELAATKEACAKEVPMKCVAPMPPILAVKLRNLGKIPQKIVEAAKKASPPNTNAAAQEGSGYLLLTKLFDDPTLFQVPVEPSEEEKGRVFPEYTNQVTKPLPTGLIRIDELAETRSAYYIKRSDTPGLRWRVELADTNVEDELLQPSSPPSEEEEASQSDFCK